MFRGRVCRGRAAVAQDGGESGVYSGQTPSQLPLCCVQVAVAVWMLAASLLPSLLLTNPTLPAATPGQGRQGRRGTGADIRYSLPRGLLRTVKETVDLCVCVDD